MKKIISTIMLIISTCLLIFAFSFYQFQSNKVQALKQHMSLLAFYEKIEYSDSDEEAKRQKEEKKRLEQEEKIRKQAELEAKKLEEKRKKEEEKIALRELKKQEELKKKEEEERRKNPPKSVILDVPLISQLPELKNGCEITSLAMMFRFASIDVDKMTLASKVIKDNTPLVYDNSGKIVYWGNPSKGFVGDITGKKPGYSINPEPLRALMEEYIPNKSLILTDCEFSDIEKILVDNRPVIVWVTNDFKTPAREAQWLSNGEVINANFSQHAVILTGFDEKNIYYNDPLSNTKNKSVDKTSFKNIWTMMGKKAVSYYK